MGNVFHDDAARSAAFYEAEMFQRDRATAVEFLVYSRKHNMWWRPGCAGYTPFMEEAGRYVKGIAEHICQSANAHTPMDDGPAEFMVPAPETEGLVTRLKVQLTTVSDQVNSAMENMERQLYPLRYIRAGEPEATEGDSE